MPAAAQAMGCRRGTPRPQTEGRRVLQAERKPGGDFYHGDRRQLTVLVSFSNRTFKGDETATVEQWDKILNAENYNEASFQGSVHDYFYAQSYGQFNVSFDLQYVQLNEELKKYRSTEVDDENSQFLVSDVVDVLLTRDIDWSRYDWNGDGYINQLLIVFAGMGSGYGGFGGGYDAIWPHQWWLSSHQDPVTKKYCQPRVVSNGERNYYVDTYCVLQELDSKGSYGVFGTICHEYSHCFGLPDFYYGSTKYVGEWDLMDYGNYNKGGYCPPCYSAHERWIMGWLTPTELTEGTTISNMAALSDKGEAYLIRNNGYEDEYYMVENRQQKGWDQAVPGSGIVVFHIDYDASLWTSVYDAPNSPDRTHYTIIPANNKTSVSSNSGWAYPYADNNQLSNTSMPAASLWYDNADRTRLMNKPLTDMQITNGLASFTFMGGTSGIQAPALSRTSQVLYKFGNILIVRDANGQTRKVME